MPSPPNWFRTVSSSAWCASANWNLITSNSITSAARSGLYNSTIISCDFGDNVCIDNINYLSHYIIGNDVMIVNTNELATTDHAKFGNGILKEGEEESIRIWLEVCNENGGRSIIPFNGMLPGDAWLWSRFRDDAGSEKIQEFTEKKFDNRRGYYGKIGDRTVIKNCKIIKDVWIGSDAYLKGANKLKNLTINSSAEGQIPDRRRMRNGQWHHRLWMPDILWRESRSFYHGLAFATEIWRPADQLLPRQ